MYRIDALKPLESIFGKRLKTTRSEVINWFTVTAHTEDSWNKTLKEFYKDIPEFKLYVDKVLLFSNEETPVQDCLLLPIHLAVNIELTRISEFLEEQPSLKWLYDTKGECVDFYFYYGVRVGKYDPIVPEDFKLEELPLV